MKRYKVKYKDIMTGKSYTVLVEAKTQKEALDWAEQE